jgi:Ni/Co efflux regulator RcnB
MRFPLLPEPTAGVGIVSSNKTDKGEPSMRKLILATVAAVIVTAPMTATVRAEDTTIIKKDDNTGDKTVVKKRDELNVLPVPHVEEKKTIIKKEHDDE